MHLANIAVTVFMGACGVGALLAFSGIAPSLIAISFFLGWWATIGAMVIAIILAVILAGQAEKGRGRVFFKRSWLGLANGAVALVFWVLFIAYVR
jgi:hypothetical protein